MINFIIKHYGGLKPVVIDGFLYVIIAVCGFAEATLTSDDVFKYMNPYLVFYIKWIVGMLGAGATALKMFRSTSYSEHQDAKKAEAIKNLTNGTQVVTQQQTTKIETTNEKTSNDTGAQPTVAVQ